MPPAINWKSYDENNGNGPVALDPEKDLSSQTLGNFFWVDSGKKTVTCTVSANNVSQTVSGTIIVDVVTVSNNVATQGWVQWYDPKDPDFKRFGLYGDPKAKDDFTEQGMTFTAQVNVPALYQPGTWQYVQTLVTDFRLTYRSGKKMKEKKTRLVSSRMLPGLMSRCTSPCLWA